MKTKLVVLAGVIVVIVSGVGWYLLSPLLNVIELDEPSPLESKDIPLTMDEETTAEFNRQMEVMKNEEIEVSDEMPSGVYIVARGKFQPKAHEVKGDALVIVVDGNRIIRFEEFETVNGPNLHVYLSSKLRDEDFTDLGKIKATKGNVNYDIPPEIDIVKYNKVLIWCKPFGVLFSYAELK